MREPRPIKDSVAGYPRASERANRIQATDHAAALQAYQLFARLNMCTKFDFEGLYFLSRYNEENIYPVSHMTATEVSVVLGNRLGSNQPSLDTGCTCTDTLKGQLSGRQPLVME